MTVQIHLMFGAEDKTIDEADLAQLVAAGYRPIVMWLHEGPMARHICNQSEALKNIEIAEREKKKR